MTVVQHAVDAISLGSLYALLALGVALIFGVARVVNFAHGELITVGGYVLLGVSGVPWPLAAVAVVAVVVVVALLMERLAFRPLRTADQSTLLIAAFAVGVLIQNAILLTEGARSKGVSFGDELGRPVVIGDVTVSRLDIVTAGVGALLVLALTLFLQRASLGLQLRAAAEDFAMARLVGVRANRVIAAAFALSGVLAAAGSLLIVAQSGTLTPDMGLQPVLIAFIATVVGGMGSLVGAALGGLTLGTITTALQVALPDDLRPYRDALVFALVIAILIFRPGGIVKTAALQERV